MTLDYCPHGFYRGWANGRCAVCYVQMPRQADERHLRAPRLRDAAMWAAFVHELRAEWLASELRRAEDAYGDLAIRCVCGRHVVDNDVTPEEQVRRFFAWLDDEPVSRADHSDRVIAKLRDMSPDEVRKTFVDAGIYDQDGNLTERYRG